jgi:hypothetical protein
VEGSASTHHGGTWPYASRNWALLRYVAADTEHRAATLLAGEDGDELLLGQVFSVARSCEAIAEEIAAQTRADVDVVLGDVLTFVARRVRTARLAAVGRRQA